MKRFLRSVVYENETKGESSPQRTPHTGRPRDGHNHSNSRNANNCSVKRFALTIVEQRGAAQAKEESS